MGISPGGKVRDHAMYTIGGHAIMHDKYQIIIQHPKECPYKGSPRDKRKTFHRWPLALERLEICCVELSAEQTKQIKDVGKTCDAAPR